MATSNRNPKLTLSEAWKHHWTVLFPNGADWGSDLENEIRRRIYSPGDAKIFMDGDKSETPAPNWATTLEICFVRDKVLISLGNYSFGAFVLFGDQLFKSLSNWAEKNPIRNACNLVDLSDRDRDDCRDLCNAAVRECGGSIRGALRKALMEIEKPTFDIYCKSVGDAFSVEKKLPVSGLSFFSDIDIGSNELIDRLRLSKFASVRIKLRKNEVSRVGPRGSFEEQDGILIEKMKRLIDNGDVRNVSQAANPVLSEAARREGSSDESVLRRLKKGFSQRHPNYSNRRGRKNPSLL